MENWGYPRNKDRDDSSGDKKYLDADFRTIFLAVMFIEWQYQVEKDSGPKTLIFIGLWFVVWVYLLEAEMLVQKGTDVI